MHNSMTQASRLFLLPLIVLLGGVLFLGEVSTAVAQDRDGASHAADEVPFDTDRGVWVSDTDGDSFPDLTEELGGTDPSDETDFPGSDLSAHVAEAKKLDFPSGSCRSPHYSQQGLRLCISSLRSATNYRTASATCSVLGGRVCDFEDLYYIYQQTSSDALFNPNGRWLGHFTGDNTVHCGNRSITFNNDPDINNFDGTCSATGTRYYWCCHTKS